MWHNPLSRAEYASLVAKAREFGQESTVMRTGQGGDKQEMIRAVIVSAEEIATNPAFADLREREGLGDTSPKV